MEDIETNNQYHKIHSNNDIYYRFIKKRFNILYSLLALT